MKTHKKKPKPQLPDTARENRAKSQPIKFGFDVPPVPTLVISKTKLKKGIVRKIIAVVEKL